MPDLSGMLLVVVILALLFDFTNGWHDSANAIATVVSTRVLRPLTAVVMAGVLNVAGAFMSTAVAKMVGVGIVDPGSVTPVVIAAALSGAILWNIFTLLLGLPTSSSHALIGGLVGAALTHGGWAVVHLKGLRKILEAMFVSPLFGFLIGWLIMVVLSWAFFRVARHVAVLTFSRLQLLSAGFMAFNHGLNDGQKFMGVFVTTLIAGGALKTFEIPVWVIVLCAVTMGLGTSFGGWRIIQTVGSKMTRLQSWQGFAAQTSAGFTIFGASLYGIPLSTTHTITSGIVGSAAAKRVSDVRWGVLKRIVLAWIVTFPFCALIAYLAATAANAIFHTGTIATL